MTYLRLPHRFHFRHLTLRTSSIHPMAVPTSGALRTPNEFLRLGIVAVTPFRLIRWTKIGTLQTKTQILFLNL
jgi:hypothetical protein